MDSIDLYILYLKLVIYKLYLHVYVLYIFIVNKNTCKMYQYIILKEANLENIWNIIDRLHLYSYLYIKKNYILSI